jgi:hypothetical protein
MPKWTDDIRSAIVSKIVDMLVLIVPGAVLAIAGYLRHSTVFASVASGIVIGAALAATISLLKSAYLRRRPSRDERVTYAEAVSISQEFWIPHGANENYRIHFPIAFAAAPVFSALPWPVPLSETPQTSGKPDKEGFAIVTGQGRSEGDGKGIKFSYTAKGRLPK